MDRIVKTTDEKCPECDGIDYGGGPEQGGTCLHPFHFSFIKREPVDNWSVTEADLVTVERIYTIAKEAWPLWAETNGIKEGSRHQPKYDLVGIDSDYAIFERYCCSDTDRESLPLSFLLDKEKALVALAAARIACEAGEAEQRRVAEAQRVEDRRLAQEARVRQDKQEMLRLIRTYGQEMASDIALLIEKKG